MVVVAWVGRYDVEPRSLSRAGTAEVLVFAYCVFERRFIKHVPDSEVPLQLE